jgi:hypothetical protein
LLRVRGGEFVTDIRRFGEAILSRSRSGEGGRLSIAANVRRFFGPTFEGEFMLGVASVAEAMATHIEQFRALCEINLETEPIASLDEFQERRDAVEARLMLLAPPKGCGASLSDHEAWMCALRSLFHRVVDCPW